MGAGDHSAGGLRHVASLHTDVLPAAYAMARQRGGHSNPSRVLVTTATWLVPSLLCYPLPVLYGTAAWRSQQPFPGAGDHSAQVISAAWLAPSLLCYPLPVLYGTTAWRSQQPFMGAGDHSAGGLRHVASLLTAVLPAACAMARQRGGPSNPSRVLVTCLPSSLLTLKSLLRVLSDRYVVYLATCYVQVLF
jgi:hypothetical protein